MKTKVFFSSVVIWLMCLSLLIPAAGAQQTDKLDQERGHDNHNKQNRCYSENSYVAARPLHANRSIR